MTYFFGIILCIPNNNCTIGFMNFKINLSYCNFIKNLKFGNITKKIFICLLSENNSCRSAIDEFIDLLPRLG